MISHWRKSNEKCWVDSHGIVQYGCRAASGGVLKHSHLLSHGPHRMPRLIILCSIIKSISPQIKETIMESQTLSVKSPINLIHVTPDAEKHIAYCARVSSPNQENPEYSKLLAYCIKNKHWSIFEMASMCVEIETSRAIAQQILRHRSFSFQEFSQRYASPSDYVLYGARRQDDKNRQNSVDDLDKETKEWFRISQEVLWDTSKATYDRAIELGIAKECARFLLPLNVKTRLYMHGTIRSWIHYLELRTAHGTQKEHKEIADGIKNLFVRALPETSKALGW